MADTPTRWDAGRRAHAYVELEHPSDLFLEIRGRDPEELAENALLAFYDQIAELDGFDARREIALSVEGSALDETLRSLLAEALYRFDTEGFVAVGGEVAAKRDPIDEAPAGRPLSGSAESQFAAGPGQWLLQARLWGEEADRSRHTLLHEIKAVTYHRLAASRRHDGWAATVLFDL